MKNRLIKYTLWGLLAAALLYSFDYAMVKDWENYCNRHGDVEGCQDGPRRNPFKEGL